MISARRVSYEGTVEDEICITVSTIRTVCVKLRRQSILNVVLDTTLGMFVTIHPQSLDDYIAYIAAVSQRPAFRG
jgi:hypothetical protein